MRPYSLYIQKEKEGSSVIDTQDEWGIVCKKFPFMTYGEAKELPKNDWKDEHGEDTYLPESEGLKLEAYDLDVEFAYKGDADTANTPIRNFLDYLTGKDGSGVGMKIYDTYTKEGRQGIYYKSVENDIYVRRSDEGDVVTFAVKFRVTDPITYITLSKV